MRKQKEQPTSGLPKARQDTSLVLPAASCAQAELDVFDYFVGMAPIEAWRTAEETRAIDPLVLAVIGTGAAEDRHYLVARW